MTQETIQIFPEWASQDAILLAWPYSRSGWVPILHEVQCTYCNIIEQVTRSESVVLLVPENPNEYASLLSELRSHCLLAPCPTNDTWCRDYNPLTLQSPSGARILVDFTFNAQGGKFVSALNNLVVRRLMMKEFFALDAVYFEASSLTFEGGALECNGEGPLLTTKPCIGDPLRNPHLCGTPYVYEALPQCLGLTDYYSLKVTPLPGDDTGRHIDTIAHFVDLDTIIYASLNNPAAQSFVALTQLERQLQELARQCPALRLTALSDVGDFPSHYEPDYLIPATYTNFLLVSSTLLLPIYGRSTDSETQRILQQALPHLEVVPVDYSILFEQHGSLHCISMQIPQGFLSPSLLNTITG